MATGKRTSEPVNSQQLEEAEAERQAQAPKPPEHKDAAQASAEAVSAGPSMGELEERTVMAEERAEAAERANAQLQEQLAQLQAQMAQLASAMRRPGQATEGFSRGSIEELADGEPVFREDEPHGVVIGDVEVAYVQNGHQFGKDHKYLRTERHHGAGRPFNPRMVGWVRPRPGQVLRDALEGFRDAA